MRPASIDTLPLFAGQPEAAALEVAAPPCARDFADSGKDCAERIAPLPVAGPRRRRPTLPYRGVAPRVPGSATSEAAAARIEPQRLSKRAVVLAYITSRGADGATRKEIARGTGLSENTVRPRVCELINGGAIRALDAEREGCAVLAAADYVPAWQPEVAHG